MDVAGIWTEDFRIAAYMVDRHRCLTLPALGNLLQEAATNHANFHRLGFYHMQEKGLIWVLNRLRIELGDLPQWQDVVTIRTWVTAMQPFAHRHWEVRSAANVPLLYGASIWLPLDAAHHRPRRLERVEVPLCDYPNPCPLPAKLPPLEHVTLVGTRTVAYSDLDMLGHVNNVQYVQWIVDDHYAVAQPLPLRAYTIQYIAEAFHGEAIEIYKTTHGQWVEYLLRRVTDGVAICRARLEVDGEHR